MYRSKIKATQEEIARVKRAANRPAIMLHIQPQPKSALETAHEIALAHGLPEQAGHYGIDLESGEFLSQYPITEPAAPAAAPEEPSE